MNVNMCQKWSHKTWFQQKPSFLHPSSVIIAFHEDTCRHEENGEYLTSDLSKSNVVRLLNYLKEIAQISSPSHNQNPLKKIITIDDTIPNVRTLLAIVHLHKEEHVR